MAKTKDIIFDPLVDNNPITLQVLGICSALAVTSSVTTALIMSISVTLVTGFSSFFIASICNFIPLFCTNYYSNGYHCITCNNC